MRGEVGPLITHVSINASIVLWNGLVGLKGGEIVLSLLEG